LRGFKAVSVALLLVMLLLAEFLFFSYFPLSITYAVSRDNPWGVFTAYLVFDGWANIIVVAFSCLMTLISTSLFWPQSRFLLPSSLLVLTNLTGILAGLVWLLSPYSATVIVVIGPHGTNTYAKAGLGMSGAAFGALGFSVTLSILALVFQGRNRPWNMTGMRASLWRFGMTGFGLLTFLGVILAVPAFLPNEAELVHSVGLLTGLVSALFVGRRTLGIEKDQLLVSSGPETLN
jgi:hypothetical protein